MFTEIQLLTKRENKIHTLNADCGFDSKIFCACSLEIGFGDKIIWSQGNAIRLSLLIEFYKTLSDSMTNPNDDLYEYEFACNDHSYVFEWNRIQTDKFKLTLKKKQQNSVTTLMARYYWAGDLYACRDTFFMNIMSILIETTNVNVCSMVAEMFFGKQEQVDYKFKIGQKVKTKIGSNVKTIREGYIINRFYHHKEKKAVYQILENGKKLEKRFYETDLEELNH